MPKKAVNLRRRTFSLLIALAAGGGWAMAGKPVAGVAAESRAGVITEREVALQLDRYLKQIHRLSPEKVFSSRELESLTSSVLSDLVLQKIFLKMAGRYKILVLDSEVRERYLIVASGIFDGNEEDFKKALAEDGWDADGYLENLREIITAEKARARYLEDVSVSAGAARAYYGAHPAEFRLEETEVSHILLSAPAADMPERGLKTVRTLLREKGILEDSLESGTIRETARLRQKLETLRDSLLRGTDFADFARRYSDDPTSKDGGALGKIRRGSMVAAFDSAAFALKNGGLSGVVQTEFGFHLIKAFSDPAGRTQEFPEVEAAISEKLRGSEEAARLKTLEKKWKVVRYGKYASTTEENP